MYVREVATRSSTGLATNVLPSSLRIGDQEFFSLKPTHRNRVLKGTMTIFREDKEQDLPVVILYFGKSFLQENKDRLVRDIAHRLRLLRFASA